MPISVASELRHGRPVAARRYDVVTLLFSGVVEFAKFCAQNTDSRGAMKIVRMLNELYTTFDVLTDPKKNPDVYKVRPHFIHDTSPAGLGDLFICFCGII